MPRSHDADSSAAHANAPKRLEVARSQITQTANDAKSGEAVVTQAKKQVELAKAALTKKIAEYQKAAGGK